MQTKNLRTLTAEWEPDGTLVMVKAVFRDELDRDIPERVLLTHEHLDAPAAAVPGTSWRDVVDGVGDLLYVEARVERRGRAVTVEPVEQVGRLRAAWRALLGK